jgi:hypothetical protein
MKIPGVLFLIVTPALWAQVDTGTIAGTVKDASGAVIQHADVTVQQTATKLKVKTTTNNGGLFAVPDLRPGVYDVSATAHGFQTVTKTSVELRVQDRLSVDFDLPVGEASTTVSVEADAQHLESETSSLGQVVEEQEIENLPLNGRNYIQLAYLGAGTSPSQHESERNSFVSNGARPIQNSYLLDGIDNKNKIVGFDDSAAQSIEPIIDAVGEFKVQTSTFSAEFGQSAGAVVNATIKSGGSQFHGTGFEFLRNSALDALPYFQTTGTTPAFKENQFGATVGGPVIKNKTFFFFAWQSSRLRNASPQLATVPTDDEKSGDFAGVAAIYDPATTRPNPDGSGYIRDPFPGNIIPASRFDTTAQKLLSLYPEANQSGAVNFFSNQTEQVDNDQYIGRIDHRFSDKDSIFGHYANSAFNELLPATLPPPASAVTKATPEARSFTTSETHIFTPSLVNEVRFGYQHTWLIQQAYDTTRLFSQYGINGAYNDPTVLGLPTFAVAGFSMLGTTGPGNLPTPATGSGNLPEDKEGRVFVANDNLSWVRGRHTFKFGFDFQQVTEYGHVTLSARPYFDFSGIYTQDPQNPSSTGASFADFLLGQSSNAQVSTRSLTNNRQHYYSGYTQDDWRVTSRLTVNAGLRYELPLPFYETNGHYANVITEPGPLFGQLVQVQDAAQDGYRKSWVNPNYRDFAPRLGLAYQLDPKTVIRAAGGIFYGIDENTAFYYRPGNNPPNFILTTYISDGIDPNIVLSQGFPSTAFDASEVVRPTVNSFVKHTPTPYVQQWNFNIQREVGAGFVAQLAYVGSSSHDLEYQINIDQGTPGAGSILLRQPLPQYSAVNTTGPYVSGNYNSLQAQLERRFSKGVSVLAAYTWGHAIDNGPSSAADDGYDPGPQNPNNLAASRGDSNYDVRQRLAFSTVYELPFGKGRPFINSSRVGQAVLGGWQLTSIFSAQTGLPITPILSYDPTNTGIIAYPNRIGSGTLSNPTVQDWFNSAAFVAPTGYSYGNSGRNILRGPGFHNIDLGLSRRVSLTERIGLEIRAEAFNLFNTPQFGFPNNTVGVSNTGAISSVVNPQREIQLALRLAF